MLNEKIYKPIQTQAQCDKYASLAKWCNKNNAHLEDKGEYYEIIANPAPALDEIKQAKISELKSSRDTEELSPIKYAGYMWDFDDKAQMRINGAITALGDNTITWTSADNEEIKKVTVDDLKGVVGASALRSNALHIKYRELKAKVEQAETIEDVEAIVW